MLAAALPSLGVDPRIAGLVGMAAMFAGASRAVLTSIVFAFETTRAANALLPLLGGCMAAYLVSAMWMRHSIMTEKIARRGVRVPEEYAPDLLDEVTAGECATRPAVSLSATMVVSAAREMLEAQRAHQAFPVCNEQGAVVGVVTRREIAEAADASAMIQSLPKRRAVTLGEERPLREAVERMVRLGIGRLPIVSADGKLVGMLTRSDVIAAWRRRLPAPSPAARAVAVASQRTG
jgi:CBS domain-containing protein